MPGAPSSVLTTSSFLIHNSYSAIIHSVGEPTYPSATEGANCSVKHGEAARRHLEDPRSCAHHFHQKSRKHMNSASASSRKLPPTLRQGKLPLRSVSFPASILVASKVSYLPSFTTSYLLATICIPPLQNRTTQNNYI